MIQYVTFFLEGMQGMLSDVGCDIGPQPEKECRPLVMQQQIKWKRKIMYSLFLTKTVFK